MSRRMISAACTNKARQQDEYPLHWLWPGGRVANMLSETSTAVIAATRKLSEVTHNQTLCASAGSGFTETRMSPCPAAFTLLGASSGSAITATCSPAKAPETLETPVGFSNCTFSYNPWP